MGFHVIRPGDDVWEDRPNQEGKLRRVADLTTAGALTQSRARIWRYPPHTRGRRHAEGAQEEVFVVLEGTLTMLLGDPHDRVEVSTGEIVVVKPGTGIQMHNTGEADVVVFAYGAPPVAGEVDYLDDISL